MPDDNDNGSFGTSAMRSGLRMSTQSSAPYLVQVHCHEDNKSVEERGKGGIVRDHHRQPRGEGGDNEGPDHRPTHASYSSNKTCPPDHGARDSDHLISKRPAGWEPQARREQDPGKGCQHAREVAKV